MKKQRDPSFTTGTPFIILLDDSINNGKELNYIFRYKGIKKNYKHQIICLK